MTVLPYEAQVASASVDPAPEPTKLGRAIRAIEAPAPKPIEWLIKDLWPRNEIGLLVGDGGAFKSTVALHLAAAIAGGYPVFDRYPTVQRPVMIVSAEDSQDVVLMRLNALIAGQGWNRKRTLNETYLMCDGEQSLGDIRWKMHFSAEVERIQPGFIVLDPWAELLGGDENSNTDARPAIKFLRSVGRSVGASIAVVHHAGKATQEKRPLDRIRGASAVPSAARVIWFFDYQDTGVAVECIKMSRAPKPEAFIVGRKIEHEADNRAQWTSARLTMEDKKAFELSRAERFVVEQLQLSPPSTHTTTSLRTLAREVGRGLSQFDTQRAMSSLQAKNIIAFCEGKQNKRYWYLTPPSEWSGPKGSEGNGTGSGPESSGGNSRPEEPTETSIASNPDLFGEPAEEIRAGSSGSKKNLPEPAGRFSGDHEACATPLKGVAGFDLAKNAPAGSAGSNLPAGSAGSPAPGYSEADVDSLLEDIDDRLGQIEVDDVGRKVELDVNPDDEDAL